LSVKLYETPQTKNAAYIKARPINPIGIFVHSTGASNATLKRYVDAPALLGTNLYGNHWNKTTATKAVHAFIGLDANKEVTVLAGVQVEGQKDLTTIILKRISSSRFVKTMPPAQGKCLRRNSGTTITRHSSRLKSTALIYANFLIFRHIRLLDTMKRQSVDTQAIIPILLIGCQFLAIAWIISEQGWQRG
jgi:hypothetical protein